MKLTNPQNQLGQDLLSVANIDKANADLTIKLPYVTNGRIDPSFLPFTKQVTVPAGTTLATINAAITTAWGAPAPRDNDIAIVTGATDATLNATWNYIAASSTWVKYGSAGSVVGVNGTGAINTATLNGTVTVSVDTAGASSSVADGTLGVTTLAKSTDVTSLNKASTPGGVASQINTFKTSSPDFIGSPKIGGVNIATINDVKINTITGTSPITATTNAKATTIGLDVSATKTALGLGTAAYLNVGTVANNVVQVLPNGKIDEKLLPSIAITELYETDGSYATEALLIAWANAQSPIPQKGDFLLNNNEASATKGWWLVTAVNASSVITTITQYKCYGDYVTAIKFNGSTRTPTNGILDAGEYLTSLTTSSTANGLTVTNNVASAGAKTSTINLAAASAATKGTVRISDTPITAATASDIAASLNALLTSENALKAHSDTRDAIVLNAKSGGANIKVWMGISADKPGVEDPSTLYIYTDLDGIPEILTKIGNLSSLTTTSKVNLVAAINEVKGIASSAKGLKTLNTTTFTSSQLVEGVLTLTGTKRVLLVICKDGQEARPDIKYLASTTTLTFFNDGEVALAYDGVFNTPSNVHTIQYAEVTV